MTETTRLILAVDSTQVKSADAALEGLAASGAKVENVTAKMQQAWRQQTAQASAAAKAAKQHAHQMQQLAFQLNDFGVQVFSGQNPFVALVQQGSQLSGTFGGVGNALRAVVGLVSGASLAMAGLATVVGGVAVAAYTSEERAARLNRTLLLTGNAAGITAGQFSEMYRALAVGTDTTVGSSRETLEALVATGRFAGDALTATARAAQLFSEASGKSADEVVQDFTGMTNGVARWAESTNRSYHFLTAAQLEYIQTLEEQGNQQKAIEVTMAALSSRVEGAAHTVTGLAGAWRDVKKAASDYIDFLVRSVGPSTTESELAKLRNERAQYETNPLFMAGGSGRNAEVARLDAQIKAQEQILAGQRANAKSAAARNAQEQAIVEWNKLQEQSLTKQQKLVKELAKANALADKAGMSQEQRAATLKAIEEKYKDKDGISQALSIGKADMASDISRIKSELAGLTGAYRNAESVLEASRAANLISEKEYYDAKRSFIQLDSEAQVRALSEENARLQSQKAAGKDRIDNLAQIAENDAKITAIRADATAQSVVLDIKQKDSLDKVARSYKEAAASAQDYLNMVARQQDRELNAFGRGSRERERAEAVSQIEERYQTQRDQLAAELRRNDITQEQYDKTLEIINTFQGKAIGQWEAYYERRTALEGDWTKGAQEAIANYLEANKNAATLAAEAWGGAISGMEDLFTEFFTTGKADWGKYIKSVIAEIIRLQVVKPILSNVFGSLSAAGSSGGGSSGALAGLFASFLGGKFADGGTPPVGKVSLVGERGPELFVPKTPGTIVPNHKLGGETNVTLNMSFGSDVSVATMAAWARLIEDRVKGAILYSKNAKGVYS